MSSSLIYSDFYGDVCKCKKDGDFYLVKTIKANNLKSKNQLDTLNAMKNLSFFINKNLSEYIDFSFNENGDFEILMEYDEDSEYESKIKYNKENHRTFEEDYIWSLAIQILNLLKYIKQNKEIKIEINPSKILLMNNGTLKVFDYGMELISNMGLSSSILQNSNDKYVTPPEYMKEEIKIIDEDAANIWKAGCIIYELLTLKHVFEFESAFDMQFKLSQIKGCYDMKIDSKYSDDFKILLSKMLIAEPEKRSNVEELLNCDIIKRRNNNLLEQKKLEKKLINASIFTFKQSLLKSSFKDSLRQIKNQNEMMENDNYEILKFSLGKSKEINNENPNNENQGTINYLKQTGYFGDNQEKEDIIKKDFKELLIGEKLRKEKENQRIIDKNDFDFNYNNPFRINNFLNKNEINEQDDFNYVNKIKFDNYLPKEREKTPLCETKNKRYFLDVEKNTNIKNKSKPKNKQIKSKDFLPKLNNPFAPTNAINSKDLKKNNNNMKNNNLTKKTEEVLKLFKGKKLKKIDDTNKLKKPFNNNNNKLSSMTNAQIDALLNNILHKQNVNLVNKIQKNTNIINNNNINNNNINKNIINMNKNSDNKIKLKALPQNKPLKNLQNNNNKISYGTVEYKSKKGKKTKFFLKK